MEWIAIRILKGAYFMEWIVILILELVAFPVVYIMADKWHRIADKYKKMDKD